MLFRSSSPSAPVNGGGGGTGYIQPTPGANIAGTDGSPGTGGGGGSGGIGNPGRAGGGGVVIIRYPNAGGQRGTGGTVTNVGGYYIHTFTGSGTFTVS